MGAKGVGAVFGERMKSGDRSLYVCTGCGKCCRWPGYVRVTEREIDRISGYLGISATEFVESYTKLTADRRGLTIVEREDGACRFLADDESCKIQAVKPQQCIDFPHKWNFPGFEDECPAIKLKIRVAALKSGRQ